MKEKKAATDTAPQLKNTGLASEAACHRCIEYQKKKPA
jgi:hypothetical protein